MSLTSQDLRVMRQMWLHVHVPKAGGSTLRQLMSRNFGDGYYNSNSLLETKQYIRDEVSEIVRCHPGVECMSDHKLSLDLPWNHQHATIRVIAFVRDPVQRFISRYFFHRHVEEVNCIAQRMTFREFANAELVEHFVHPQTNSQICFLNGGRDNQDMSIIHDAIATNRCFLFPIERFDEACICLERMYPNVFVDLGYVRANVSKRDAEVSKADQEYVRQYLKHDEPVVELASQFLDRLLNETFSDSSDRHSTLTHFRKRCSQRNNNFHRCRTMQGEAESS